MHLENLALYMVVDENMLHVHVHNVKVLLWYNGLTLYLLKQTASGSRKACTKYLRLILNLPHKFLRAYGHFAGSYGLYRVHRDNY